MIKYGLVVLSLINAFVSTKMYIKVSETLSPRRLNLISFFYYYFVILSFIGSILLTLDINSFYMSTSLKNPEGSMLTGWILINLVMGLTPITMLVIQRFFPNSKHVFNDFCERPVSEYQSSRNLFLGTAFFSLIGLVALVYVVKIIGFGNLPVINALQGASGEELAVLRQLVGRGFKGNIYIRNFLAFGIIPLMSYVAFVEMVRSKKKEWIILFGLLFVLSSLILTYDLQKAPILRYLFTYFILIQLFMKPISPRLFRTGVAGLVAIILGFYMFVTPIPMNELFSFNRGPVNRVLKSQVFPTYLHMDIFPARHEFLVGASFPTAISTNVFGVDHIRSGRLVMEIIRPEAVADGTAGVLNTLYVAEAYANFSWLGAILGIVWVSVMFYLIHLLILSQEKTAITIALYAYIANLLVNATQGGFVDFIYNPGLVFVFGLAIALTLIAYPNKFNRGK